MEYTIVDRPAVAAINTLDQVLKYANIKYAIKGGFAVQLNIVDEVNSSTKKNISELEHLKNVVLRPTEDIDLVANADIASIYIALNKPENGLEIGRRGDDFVLANFVDSTQQKIAIGTNAANKSSTPEYMQRAIQRKKEIDLPYTSSRNILSSVLSPEDIVVGKLKRWETRDVFDVKNLFKYFSLDKQYIERIITDYFSQREEQMLVKLRNLEESIAEGN